MVNEAPAPDPKERTEEAASNMAPNTPAAYRTTPVFDETSLPAALRRDHSTKPGVWGVIRVLEGEIAFTILDPPTQQRLTPDCPGLILPEQLHFVTPSGPFRMQVEFYDCLPDIPPSPGQN